MMRLKTVLLAGAVAVTGPPALAASDVVTLVAVKDNTLYEDSQGDVSNGAGDHFFAGKNDNGDVRRGLIAFDLAGSSIPPGSTIVSVTLQLYMSRTEAGNEDVSLYRVLTDWGEGASDAPQEEGAGAPAEDGDATWLYTFYVAADPESSPAWASPGGDYVDSPCVAAQIGDEGYYTWGSTAEMVADVQAWLDDPATNYGWSVMGNEGPAQTAKRFDTRENGNAERRPQLTVQFDAPPPCPWDLDADGMVGITDFLMLLADWGATGDNPADFNGDGVVGILDFLALLANWGSCP